MERRQEEDGDLVVRAVVAMKGVAASYNIAFRTIHYRSIYRNATHIESMHY